MQRAIITLCIAALAIAGCDKSTGPGGAGQMTMYMVDAPAHYDAVNIVVKEVAVHSSTQGWVTINSTERTFNLLSLTNGAAAVLGSASLAVGQYTEIRLILGAGSTVVVDGQTFGLTVASGFETGIKLVHSFDIEEGARYDLLLDFDAARSIIQVGLTYVLKPTIRVQALASSASISGTVQPSSASALITATSANDTATTYATSSGAFKFVGLASATYSLTVQATQGSYRDTTLGNVAAMSGATITVGTIVLTSR